MKIAIIGFDTEGRASYEYLSARGHDITIHDQDPDKQVPAGVGAVLGASYLDDLDRYDMIVRTAGLPPRKILENNPAVADKITTHVNEFLAAVPTRRIIGVTGTKGKGTTSTLIAKMLEASGHTVRLGGNIGVPPLTFIDGLDADSWVVLELSSFQLIDLRRSPHLAVCLMVVPEHLDWHADAEEYYTAKEQLFVRQADDDIAIYYHDNATSRRIAGAGQGRKVPYCHSPGAEVIDGAIVIEGREICRTSDLKLLGQHNWQNACAAVTAVWCALDGQPRIEALRQVLTSFSGLPFRLEFRRTINGIRYYNDSFASAPPAPIAALEAVDGMKVIIIGGYDRQLDLGELIAGLQRNTRDIRHILVIGAAKGRIAAELQKNGFANFTASSAMDMPAVVNEATALAAAGDAVILSPGFPSFDMFRNFEDRGQQFNAAVEAL